MKIFAPRSLFWTFAGSFLAVLALATLLQIAALFAVVTPALEDRVNEDAIHRMNEAVARIQRSTALDSTAVSMALRSVSRGRDGLSFTFEATDGSIVEGGVGPQHGKQGMRGRFRGNRPAFLPEGPSPFGDRHRLDQADILIDGVVVGQVVVSAPRRPLWFASRGALFRLGIFLPIAMVVAAVAGLVLFRVFVRRLRRLEYSALRVAEGDLETRVEDLGADEIGRLGRQFNAMTDSLAKARSEIETNDDQRRRLLADVSHELATPLTSVRGFAETLLNPEVPLTDVERTEYLRTILSESKRIDFLVKDLFELSRLESGATAFTTEPIDLVALTQCSLDRYQNRAEAAKIACTLETTSPEIWVQGDGHRLEQAVDNLLLNVLRHANQPGELAISFVVQHSESKPLVTLSLADSGPGFREEDLPRLFDRFFRGDPSRSGEGTGLGLAIVREIVKRHGGEIRALNGANGGAVIEIDLPVIFVDV